MSAAIRLPMIRSAEDLTALVQEVGFLPFFVNDIPGFSIAACTPPELWFSAAQDGPWEWKGPVARTKKCLYGKFFRKKACFISAELAPDFLNYRRDGYDFDARFDEGKAFYADRPVFDVVYDHGPITTDCLKDACGYEKGSKGFDPIVTRLQMQTYLCISDFIYREDRFGRTYGWGVAQYATPEQVLGYDTARSAYCREPQESKARLLKHLSRVLPNADEKALLKIIG